MEKILQWWATSRNSRRDYPAETWGKWHIPAKGVELRTEHGDPCVNSKRRFPRQLIRYLTLRDLWGFSMVVWGFFACFFFCLFLVWGLLKIDYCIIIWEHIFSTFSASSGSEEVRKLYLLWFKCFDSQQSKCETSPRASRRECMDLTELLNPSAISALNCSLHPAMAAWLCCCMLLRK